MWQYTDSTNLVVFRITDSGAMESRAIDDVEIAAWLAAGGIPLAAG